MKIQWKKLLICLAIPLGVGALSALISGGMGRYNDFVQPPLSPPGWVFPVVWTILYLLMGYASYRILVSDAPEQQKRNALTWYGIQLFFNFIWSPVFFGLDQYLAAFFILLVLWVAVYITMRKFDKIDTVAADLLLPYTLWLTFAAYLNIGVYFLN